jgi:hypothetical protein
VIRPAEPPAARTPPPAPATPPSDRPTAEAPARRTAGPSPETRRTAPAPERSAAAEQPPPAVPLRQTPPASSITAALPPPGTSATAAPAIVPQPQPTAALAPERSGFPLLPWLVAAVALAAAAGFILWRNRARHAVAGGPRIDLFEAPEPARPPLAQPRAPAPVPAQPPAAPAPAPLEGIVSTRLRPWLELSVRPQRCIVTDEAVTFEFELDVSNSGNAAARAILVEASLFNAGPTQDEEIGAFFANPAAQGERIDSLPPLQRLTLATQVVTPRHALRPIEAGGRQVLVPVLAFNTLYSWGGSAGQSSASYLLGRDRNGEKLSPFRLDLGPRVFRGLGARLLPGAIRS